MSNEKKKDTAPEQPNASGADAKAAAALEREARASQDISTYTHEFKSPFTFHCITEDVIEDTTVEELTFDWGALTGNSYLEIEDELLMRGKTPASFCWAWLSGPARCAMPAAFALLMRGLCAPCRYGISWRFVRGRGLFYSGRGRDRQGWSMAP